jgi:hypothetical protein
VHDHTILASDDSFGSVSVCPGGVVHVNLQHVSLKLLPSDFTKLSDLIARANINFGKRCGLADGKPHLQLVSKDPQDTPQPDPGE